MDWWRLAVRRSLAGRYGAVIHGVTEVVLEEAGVRGATGPVWVEATAKAPEAPL